MDLLTWRLRHDFAQKEREQEWKEQRRRLYAPLSAGPSSRSRRASIRNRLLEAGFHPDDVADTALAGIKELSYNVAKPMSFYEWPSIWQSSRRELDRLLRRRDSDHEHLRKPRRAALFALYEAWADDAPENEYPSDHVFAHLPIVMETVEPDGPVIDDACWQRILPRLLEDIGAWRVLRSNALLTLAGRSLPLSNNEHDPARLLIDVAWGFRDGQRILSPVQVYPRTASFDCSCDQDGIGPETDLARGIFAHVEAHLHFSMGQHVFLSGLAQLSSKKRVADGLRGADLTLPDGDDATKIPSFSCPLCPDRPPRRLANFVRLMTREALGLTKIPRWPMSSPCILPALSFKRLRSKPSSTRRLLQPPSPRKTGSAGVAIEDAIRPPSYPAASAITSSLATWTTTLSVF